jgi:hypothetical protein
MIKIEYKEAINKITQILNQTDPFDLIGKGGLPDEYSAEAELIYAKLGYAKNKNELFNIVLNVFIDQFSIEQCSDKSIYRKIAAEVNRQFELF